MGITVHYLNISSISVVVTRVSSHHHPDPDINKGVQACEDHIDKGWVPWVQAWSTCLGTETVSLSTLIDGRTDIPRHNKLCFGLSNAMPNFQERHRFQWSFANWETNSLLGADRSTHTDHWLRSVLFSNRASAFCSLAAWSADASSRKWEMCLWITSRQIY